MCLHQNYRAAFCRRILAQLPCSINDHLHKDAILVCQAELSRWKKGKQLIDRGNILVREGQNKIDDGNRMIEEGQKIQRESEESYKNIKN